MANPTARRNQATKAADQQLVLLQPMHNYIMITHTIQVLNSLYYLYDPYIPILWYYRMLICIIAVLHLLKKH